MSPRTVDPRPERHRLKARLEEIARKTDSIIDLAAASPENQDMLTDRLGRLRVEKREIENQLSTLEQAPIPTTDPEPVVDAILKGLADAKNIFEQGTMEERKRVIRAFIGRLTVEGQSRHGELRTKKLPTLQNSTGSSFKMVAGTGFEPVTFGL